MSMLPHYYTTADADFMAACAGDDKQAATVKGMGQGFADKFGAVALFTRGFNPVFAGVTFTKEKPCKASDLWSPQGKNGAVILQTPKSKTPSKKRMDALVALRKQWIADWPHLVCIAWDSRVLTALGVTPVDLSGHMLYLHKKDGVAYLASSLPLGGVGLAEITCSDYKASNDAPAFTPLTDEEAAKLLQAQEGE